MFSDNKDLHCINTSSTDSIKGPSLPRSIRWRLQMGLLSLPTKSNRSLYDQNRNTIRLQQARYDELAMRHDLDCILPSCSKRGSITSITEESVVSEQTLSAIGLLTNQSDVAEDRDKSLKSLQLIRKDVARLNPEHAQYYHSRNNWKQLQGSIVPLGFAESVTARSDGLIQVLRMYTKQHGTYRRGMHEICSYVMLAIDMDIFDQITSRREDCHHILSEQSLLCNTYAIFESFMVPLRNCYKECATRNNSIVADINHTKVGRRRTNEVHCAKWTRLASTDRLQPWCKIFRLWDLLFDLTTKEQSIMSMDVSQYTRAGSRTPLKMGAWELPELLKTVRESLFSVKQWDLLAHSVGHGVVETLLGCQTVDDVAPVISTLLASLYSMQTSPQVQTAPSAESDDSKKKSQKWKESRRLYMQKMKRRTQSPKRSSKSKISARCLEIPDDSSTSSRKTSRRRSSIHEHVADPSTDDVSFLFSDIVGDETDNSCCGSVVSSFGSVIKPSIDNMPVPNVLASGGGNDKAAHVLNEAGAASSRIISSTNEKEAILVDFPPSEEVSKEAQRTDDLYAVEKSGGDTTRTDVLSISGAEFSNDVATESEPNNLTSNNVDVHMAMCMGFSMAF